MSDSYEHNINDHEDPLPGPTWIIGILGTVLLGVVVLGVTALFFNADARMVEEKVFAARYPELDGLLMAQQAKLEGPPRIVEINENERVIETVVIPIEQAMEKIASGAIGPGPSSGN